ncbi:MAG: deoxyhypusine synthase family protein [Candidatus Bathyarchaeia archaeon]
MSVDDENFVRDPVVPLTFQGNVTARELVKSMGGAGAFNAGRLFEACRLIEEKLRSDCLLGVSVAGAIIPAGMGRILGDMMERGQIDFLVTTGANLYHDIHMAMGTPFFKGSFNADDETLRKKRLDRVYDIWVSEDALVEFDDVVCSKILPKIAEDFTYGSTAEFHYALGRVIRGMAKHPRQSVVVRAYEHKVPIFCPSPADSSIGMDLAKYNVVMKTQKPIKVDPDKDIIQSTALTLLTQEIGALILGGGAPKNFLLQTQPMLEQILGVMYKGYDWVVQFSVDTPQHGGLSGATPHEAISWGKVRIGRKNNLIVAYGDVTISLPLLAAFVAPVKRKPKKLVDRLPYAESDIARLYDAFITRKQRADSQAKPRAMVKATESGSSSG